MLLPLASTDLWDSWPLGTEKARLWLEGSCEDWRGRLKSDALRSAAVDCAEVSFVSDEDEFCFRSMRKCQWGKPAIIKLTFREAVYSLLICYQHYTILFHFVQKMKFPKCDISFLGIRRIIIPLALAHRRFTKKKPSPSILWRTVKERYIPMLYLAKRRIYIYSFWIIFAVGRNHSNYGVK